MISTESGSKDIVTLINPTDKDLTYTWDSKPITIAANSEDIAPAWLGRHLYRHLAQHGLQLVDGERFQCESCDKVYSEKQQLVAHRLIHTHPSKKAKE